MKRTPKRYIRREPGKGCVSKRERDRLKKARSGERCGAVLYAW